MSSKNQPDVRDHAAHEELLMRIVTGDESPDSPAAVALLQGCSSCRTEYESLHSIQAALDQDAAEMADYEKEPAEPLTFADRHALERLREKVVLEAASNGRGPLRFSTRWALAAALVVAAGAVAWRGLVPSRKSSSEAPRLPGETLGESKAHAMSPQGLVDDFGVFRIPGTCPVGGYCLVTIRDSSRRALFDPQVATVSGTELTWKPTRAQLERMPRSIIWEYSIRDISKQEIDWGKAEATRRDG